LFPSPEQHLFEKFTDITVIKTDRLDLKWRFIILIMLVKTLFDIFWQFTINKLPIRVIIVIIIIIIIIIIGLLTVMTIRPSGHNTATIYGHSY